MRHALILALAAPAILPTLAHAQWVAQTSGTTARLRGISVVDDRVAWASGASGTILRTIDGGKTWQKRPVAGGDALDFRDIQGFDALQAVALSIGPGELSRIYRTVDGGATWTRTHTNPDADGFLDAFAFRDDRRGLALGDPVGGRFVVLRTEDGGVSWSRVDPAGMPAAREGEGAFAASGTCLAVHGRSNAWFGTGAGRVFRSTDDGRSWTAHETPIRSGGGSAGVFSLTIAGDGPGLAVGGDYKRPDDREKVVVVTDDGGRTWRLPTGRGPSGYRSGVATFGGRIVAVGPNGSDVSTDGGQSWTPLDGPGFHAVDDAIDGSIWAVGEHGRIGRLGPAQ